MVTFENDTAKIQVSMKMNRQMFSRCVEMTVGQVNAVVIVCVMHRRSCLVDNTLTLLNMCKCRSTTTSTCTMLSLTEQIESCSFQPLQYQELSTMAIEIGSMTDCSIISHSRDPNCFLARIDQARQSEHHHGSADTSCDISKL